MIGIIDYGSGNLSAISTLLEKQKIDHVITSDIETLKVMDKYILPGVGAFDPSMKTLRESGLVDVLNVEVLEKKKPVLGICVGMHLLADGSEEGTVSGLGWIPGFVKKIQIDPTMPPPHLPHMGWNSISTISPHSEFFKDVDEKKGFYFLHSYYFSAEDSDTVAATVEFSGKLTCGVVKENIYGMQFHPEKSHQNGMMLFRNFEAL
jgi:glutamine amidotransferase